MKNIPRKIIEEAYSYPDYIKLVNDLFENNKATGDNHSEAMLNYTKLNIARMRRLDKTTRLISEVESGMNVIKRKLIWLVITEGWCGDAAQIVPVLNHMAMLNENVDLKLVLRDENPEIMDAFLTNGARSIPILIILDESTGEVLNHWGPRPHEVQAMVMNAKAEAEANPENSKEIWNEAKRTSQLWYAKDKTKSIQREVIGVL